MVPVRKTKHTVDLQLCSFGYERRICQNEVVQMSSSDLKQHSSLHNATALGGPYLTVLF